MDGFRFPDGVEFLGENDGTVSFSVSIPIDEDGYLGRECPKCEQHFRINADDYEALPEETSLWCCYCGHQNDHSDFLTRQQLERIRRPAIDYANQLVDETFQKSFGRTHRSRRSGLSISYRSKPFFPAPLPGIDEERMIRERTCERCGLHYAVFGEHRFCPACGLLSSLQIALDALTAEATRLDVLGDLTDEDHFRLRETGVLDRTYVDTIENIVSVVEAHAERTFKLVATDPERALAGKGKIFQRLEDLADLFEAEFFVDLRAEVGSKNWLMLKREWAVRHVFTHNDGIVDQKYLRTAGDGRYRVGERLTVDEADCRKALARAEGLCKAIAGPATGKR